MNITNNQFMTDNGQCPNDIPPWWQWTLDLTTSQSKQRNYRINSDENRSRSKQNHAWKPQKLFGIHTTNDQRLQI